MKKVLIVLLAVLVSLSALAGAGLVGYHLGIARASMALRGKADTPFSHDDRFFESHHMPGDKFHHGKNGIQPGFAANGFGGRHHPSRGFGSALPIFILGKFVLFGLILFGVYKLFTGNGWQLSLTRIRNATPPSSPAESLASPKPRKGKQ